MSHQCPYCDGGPLVGQPPAGAKGFPSVLLCRPALTTNLYRQGTASLVSPAGFERPDWGISMRLSDFNVVHGRDDVSALDDPLVHCFDGKQVVLAYVARQALMDYFRIAGNQAVTLRQWNLVVDRNLEAFKAIIEAKYKNGDWRS